LEQVAFCDLPQRCRAAPLSGWNALTIPSSKK
jgi:hypothetical protein